MNCETTSTTRDLHRREEAAHIETLRTRTEDRTALVERARKLVESGALLTKDAARETARAMLVGC